ncbi:AmmeMemoRadiSam system protein B [Nitrogeniibacter mangrovi]|uniref:MEMO1 family protein G3580_09295 n=1 Tax=Nitrogeniibacter mangrovi TaxID=2016596 RepID=A0A6C1B495_9RHOO|nr:AmmeMemoRadiSam system protein B [Nitrogeniibacter mangrovi]QID17819.1 AmmeMemoRadiSam system protein B [Nitrogeniibacter mangrovi]
MANASVRPAAVAGAFYPADPRALSTMIGDMLSAAVPLETVNWPKAVIVPHAGYVYSGPIAAAAYNSLRGAAPYYRRVVMLGPAHREPVDGFALPASQWLATPLGEVAVDRDSWLALQAQPDVSVDERAHAFEHCLEVQLPFLQTVLEHITVVPILVGRTSSERVAQLLESLWGQEDTLILISSDLSHYLPYHQARWRDQATVEEILQLQPKLNFDQACGALPVNGLLIAADRHHLRPVLLDQRNSGDTAGDRNRVVGYSAIAFCEERPHVAH